MATARRGRFGVLAERTVALTPPTGFATLERLARAWFASRAMQVSVNVDLATLSCAQSELLDLMSNAPGCLEHITLEITEGSFQDFRAEHLKTLCKLKLKKVKLSMDDFGTSHSNFGRLFRIAFEEVKSLLKEEAVYKAMESIQSNLRTNADVVRFDDAQTQDASTDKADAHAGHNH